MYAAFDGNAKGLSFQNLVSGLVVFMRGRPEERTQFVFHVYDTSGSGLLTRESMESMLLPSESPSVLDELFQHVRACALVGAVSDLTFSSFRLFGLRSATRWTLTSLTCGCDATPRPRR